MPISEQQLSSVIGSTAYDSAGDKVGDVTQAYLDDSTGAPTWVTVKTGLFGSKESFAPIEGASFDGSQTTLGVTKDKIKGAPNVDVDQQISDSEQDELYRYYGLTRGGAGYNTDTTTTTGGHDTAGAGTTTGVDAPTGVDAARTGAYDTSGPNTDDAITLSEERLRVGTENREVGVARLRKYVVTETVQVPVTTSREEVRVVREPITDANVGSAMSGKDISEEEVEVVLHETRPVVATETVPVERVRLDTETVTEQTTVSGEVRKEKLDVDGVTTTGTTGTDETIAR
jgi:uncharacterized protein (TIGR02271 family)